MSEKEKYEHHDNDDDDDVFIVWHEIYAELYVIQCYADHTRVFSSSC
jgi:hypothetical protein